MLTLGLNLPAPVIAITIGDPAGVGPEVTAKALKACACIKNVRFLVIGNASSLQPYLNSNDNAFEVLHLESEPGTIHTPGKPTSASGKDSLLYLDHAVKLLRNHSVHALVTAPVAKEAVIPFHPGFKGHTTYLAKAFGLNDVEMLFVARKQRVVLVTRHVPLVDVPRLVTTQKVVSVLKTTITFIREHFGIKDPSVAVCGLNPHAGEGGHIGTEDISQITPAVLELRHLGFNVTGPLPADTIFEPHLSAQFDLIAAMYHDQALTALKAQYFKELVNVTAGLPFIRTSPAHGTAFGIAGKNKADPGSMIAALKLAAELV